MPFTLIPASTLPFLNHQLSQHPAMLDQPWAEQTDSDSCRHTDPRTSHKQCASLQGTETWMSADRGQQVHKVFFKTNRCILSQLTTPSSHLLQYFVQPPMLKTLPQPSLLDHRGSNWEGILKESYSIWWNGIGFFSMQMGNKSRRGGDWETPWDTCSFGIKYFH